MAEVRCPICGKPNPEGLEICGFCGERLDQGGAPSLQVGQEPAKKGPSDVEREKSTNGDQVRPGEAPTHKNDADQEKTLPSWLRSLRENKDTEADESTADDRPAESLPFGPRLNPSPDSSNDQLDWLSGLRKTTDSDEDETPDWMGGLREVQAGAPDKASATSAGSGSVESNGPSAETAAGQEELPDWLQSLQSQADTGEKAPAAAQGEGEHSDWLDSLISATKAHDTGGQPGSYENEGETLDWLDSMKARSAADDRSALPSQSHPRNKDSMPDRLTGLPGIPEESPQVPSTAESAAPAENLPDWLNKIKGKTIDAVPGPVVSRDLPGKKASNLDRPPEPGSIPVKSGTPGGDHLPSWLSGPDENTITGPGKPAEVPAKGLTPAGPPGEIPDWITRFHADTNGAEGLDSKRIQFESNAEAPANEDSESLPDWLAGIRPSTEEPPTSGTPALLSGNDIFATGDANETAFPLETPDWLLKIIPEQASEQTPQGNADGSTLENPEVSDLPSWVQAMRPVESVVAEARPESAEVAGVTEHSGPLAGLSGVLPVGPGIGQLSKPPAYSVKLQATESQQRYAVALENLVNSESQPQAVKSDHVATNRLWRWLVSVLLILAVGLPLVTHYPISPATGLKTAEMLSAFSVVGSLPPDAPVLVVFDYDPGLSGEMEAAATPLMDQLMLQGPRLALISTSPTGPALAERFLTDSSVSPLIAGHNYQPGQQYVDLGYLAGGASGIQFFAQSPADAARFTPDGQQAWQLPPLLGVQKLSDFAAILVLTDNGDTGRAWIEQTGSSIGSTPLLMVISAQAEPLLLPYYDSGQIKGLVSGLAGGEAYAQTYVRPDGQTGPAQQYWNSFSAGVLVAEILIVLGALWYGISSRFSGRTRTRVKV